VGSIGSLRNRTFLNRFLLLFIIQCAGFTVHGIRWVCKARQQDTSFDTLDRQPSQPHLGGGKSHHDTANYHIITTENYQSITTL